MTTRRPGALSLTLILAGLLTIIGSFLTWSICPDTSCGDEGPALFVLVDRSGVEWGEGVVTTLLGAFIVRIGLGRLRSPDSPAGLASWLGLAVMAAVAVHVVRLHVLPGPLFYGPSYGAMIDSVGGLLAAIAGATDRLTSARTNR
jgi:hypothetical protein